MIELPHVVGDQLLVFLVALLKVFSVESLRYIEKVVVLGHFLIFESGKFLFTFKCRRRGRGILVCLLASIFHGFSQNTFHKKRFEIEEFFFLLV